LRRPLAGIVLALGVGAGLHGCAKKHSTVIPMEPGFGKLEISSQPSGAAIRIDGDSLASVTPDDFSLVEGMHRIELRMSGHAFTPASTTLAVPAGGDVKFTFVEYAPLLQPDAAAHAFDPQPLETASAPWCLTVTNHGNAPAPSGTFAVTGVDSSGFVITSGADHPALAAGAAQGLCVAFHPQHTGASHAAIRIGTTDVSVSGTSYKVPCQLHASADTHDFGAEVGGQSYPSWCFTIRNDDTATCSDTLQLAGANPGEFAIVSGGVYVLAPGQSQDVCVAYVPTVPGPVSASITVGAGAVSLTGTGIGSCSLSAPTTPDGVRFGSVCVGQTATKRLVMTNSGNLPCTVSATGCGPLTVSPASTTVRAGSSSTFTVTFRPGVVHQDLCTVVLGDGTNSWPTYFQSQGIDAPVAEFDTIATGIPLLYSSPIGFHPNVTTNGSAITSWLWDFGDGITSSDSLPTHAYAAGGSYLVTLTVTNACGTSTAFHSYCISEPAYIYVWHIDQSDAPDYTTNIPSLDNVPLILYRGPLATYGSLGQVICGNVISGEILAAGRDRTGTAQGASETIGTAGQSFGGASLPIPSNVVNVKVNLSVGSPSPPFGANGPFVYIRTNKCDPQIIGQAGGQELNCLNLQGTTHCARLGGDSRVEWGVVPQILATWLYVGSVRIEFGNWWVCPSSAPQTRSMQVVNSPSR
jgi:PKD repeat protein